MQTMKSRQNAVFTLMVDNEFGVLTRITALIRRSGWNISSLAVAETENTGVSRLTVCLECRNNSREFVLERLAKLNCVREITLLSPDNQVAQELALVRVKSEAASGFRGKPEVQVLLESENETILSLACEPVRMNELLDELKKEGVIEIARTGTIALKLPQKEDA